MKQKTNTIQRKINLSPQIDKMIDETRAVLGLSRSEFIRHCVILYLSNHNPDLKEREEEEIILKAINTGKNPREPPKLGGEF